MTPSEKNVVKSLVAVAWADGRLEAPEAGVIEGLLCGFDATEEEEKEVLEYAKTKRTLSSDIPLGDMGEEDRELLLANAALLAHADGEQSESEKKLIDDLIGLLGFSPDRADEIIESASDGALQLGSRVREGVD